MKKVITGRDVEALLREGRGLDSIPAGALLTPTAKDAIKEARTRRKRVVTGAAVRGEPSVPDYEFRWEPGRDPQSPEEIAKFFHSSEIETLK